MELRSVTISANSGPKEDLPEERVEIQSGIFSTYDNATLWTFRCVGHVQGRDGDVLGSVERRLWTRATPSHVSDAYAPTTACQRRGRQITSEAYYTPNKGKA